MEYKEKYKNVMEVLKKAASDPECEDERFCCVVYDLFPELAESEDERIKKELIFYLGDMPEDTELRNGVTNRDVLVWLEKQGNHKPIDKIQLGKKYKCIASPRYSTFRRGNIYKPVDNFLCNLMNLCYECFEPIEDSEQKPADKVEPKFKIKYAGREYNVLEIKENMGIIWYGIEDEPNHIDYVKANSCEIISGYAIKENGSPYPTKPVVFSEKKPKRMISAEAKEAMYDKPACVWSEEDMFKVQKICEYLNEAKKYYADITEVRDCIDWLKSLKQRIGG